MSRTPKEAIYDEQVSPLMAQILSICNANKIAMVADFELGPDPDQDGNSLKCTSALLDEDFEPGAEQLEALRLLRRRPGLMAFTISREAKP